LPPKFMPYNLPFAQVLPQHLFCTSHVIPKQSSFYFITNLVIQLRHIANLPPLHIFIRLPCPSRLPLTKGETTEGVNRGRKGQITPQLLFLGKGNRQWHTQQLPR
jgi:hypothetical protein